MALHPHKKTNPNFPMNFQLNEPKPQLQVPITPFREWNLPDGKLWAYFYALDANYLIRFPGFADFYIAPTERKVVCTPNIGVSNATINHLFLNQVKPLVLSLEGKIVLHASAIEMNGDAVAFAAPTGQGKSTLAASFAMSGNPFLTDDSLILEKSENAGYLVQPSHPSVRLWSDSRQHLISKEMKWAPDTQYTSKIRVPAADGIPYYDQICALKAIYILDANHDAVTIEPIASQEAIIQMVSHSFILDTEDRTVIARQFDWFAKFVESVPCFQLAFPRCFEALPTVHAALRQHVAEGLSNGKD